MLNELAKKVYQNAVSKGFYDNGKGLNMGERLALIHSEVSEALEADRKGKYFDSIHYSLRGLEKSTDTHFKDMYLFAVKGTFEEEMADIIIRVLDTCELKGIDIEAHVIAKMRYNSFREKIHGKKY